MSGGPSEGTHSFTDYKNLLLEAVQSDPNYNTVVSDDSSGEKLWKLEKSGTAYLIRLKTDDTYVLTSVDGKRVYAMPYVASNEKQLWSFELRMSKKWRICQTQTSGKKYMRSPGSSGKDVTIVDLDDVTSTAEIEWVMANSVKLQEELLANDQPEG